MMKIGIIGCGNMGQALLAGIIAKGFIARRNILVSDKARKRLKFARLKLKINIATSNSELIKRCRVIILAVKPQDADAVLRDIAWPSEKKLLISICAGISTQKLERRLGKVAVVRLMPNIPALISQGISAISSGKYATAKDKKLAKSIFSCIGEVVEVKEELMNAVTAISGSGPAYFFYLAERLMEAAKGLGISSQVAQKLVLKTALGTAMLMSQSQQTSRALRKRVSSKGGTTEAAFKVFREKGLDKILALAFKAAAKRSNQLSKKYKD